MIKKLFIFAFLLTLTLTSRLRSTQVLATTSATATKTLDNGTVIQQQQNSSDNGNGQIISESNKVLPNGSLNGNSVSSSASSSAQSQDSVLIPNATVNNNTASNSTLTNNTASEAPLDLNRTNSTDIKPIPSGSNNQNFTIDTESESVQNESIDAGKTFNILLSGNPTTGYSWELNSTSPNSTVITAYNTSGVYVAKNDQDSGRVGGGNGYNVFSFNAVSQGKANLVFLYKRPWEQTAANNKTVEITVNSKP